MASKTQQTETIRKRKSKPNKDNLKKNRERIRHNLEVLEKVAEGKD